MTSRRSDAVKAGRITSIYSKQGSSKRLHGRITKEDIRSAGLRRWNGRSRITTDWFNLYQEPELCFPSGDLLVYLRQPGQSSRGPSFRVHTRVLRERGLETLLERCGTRPSLHASRECLLSSCPGCGKHTSASELYIPAPITSSVDAVFDHHITTRNFFAWLYDLPLAGRTLGVSLVALKERIDQYRDACDPILNKREIIAYAESQKYLDFRECVDHALAALLLAEQLRQGDMWIDAFAHAVGMSHRDINSSLEYATLNKATQSLILESRLEMDVRLARASMSIETFFGDDLSGNFLGLSQAARDHFDRFRSFLHGFYIEKYGFWPPAGFSSEASKHSIYGALYSDFRNLYHHLVDPDSSADAGDYLSSAGGICTLQNIQAFDSKHGFDTLPHPLPQLPQAPTPTVRTPTLSRRRSWNPVAQKRIERADRKTARIQALIKASDRDVQIMNCPLVRRFSEFESNSIADDLEHVSWTDGRKVRWILVYAILQTLISIVAAPKHVRNTEGLSYSLCCHVPTKMPWVPQVPPKDKAQPTHKELVPDIDYLHGNTSTGRLDTRLGRSTSSKERRQTMPARSNSILSMRSPSIPRVPSLRRLLSRRQSAAVSDEPPVPPVPSQPHCEILVHGYGNGLNEVELNGQKTMTLPSPEQMSRRSSLVPNVFPVGDLFQKRPELRMPHDGDEDVPDLSPTSSSSVSRETSNASSGSTKTKSTDTEDDIPTPVDNKDMTHLVDILKASAIDSKSDKSHIYHEIDGLPGSIHINTKTWDEILGQ
ncbi:hypothetical protein PMZ80_006658 [Knufia obscura]|uniref:DUF8004 domain-containing protein n=1 Tax=Knufia obscura TaxID=1635080 RepID=A0ABR0RLA6_9EURO|nr:hypothetical protein PMZ80_006658 [Knufia obscura]